ncbi:MAG: hypothetical protein C0516_05270 [Gemmatimonas sp.]|jgi:hypothetical protein|uniref:hypothetical protein n=1 Tax=Gemmatimonas sp. UBA7669 TaxID=1946568 RepID=UPI0025BB3E70|nr:hypothetical protein [Gemmatimonas sp. UBA7669]MBA3917980.1 hypothetical protein [Gemmatimonas sp.]
MTARPANSSSLLLVFLFLALPMAGCMRLSSRQADQPDRDRVYSGLIGKWRGTLEVQATGADAVDPDEVPTEVLVRPAPDRDGLSLQFRYRDVFGRGVTNERHLHFNKTLTLAEWEIDEHRRREAYVVVSQSGGGTAPLRLVLEADGTADAKPARIRETIEVTPGAVEVTQEARKAGEPFTFRHRYRLRRAE